MAAVWRFCPAVVSDMSLENVTPMTSQRAMRSPTSSNLTLIEPLIRHMLWREVSKGSYGVSVCVSGTHDEPLRYGWMTISSIIMLPDRRHRARLSGGQASFNGIKFIKYYYQTCKCLKCSFLTVMM